MVFKKLFGGRSPQDAEKKADTLFAAGEYGRAKMEYESALEKWRRAGRAGEDFEGRVAEPGRGEWKPDPRRECGPIGGR